MKNIHTLSTDKPSNYVINYMEQNMQWQNIFITNNEVIKEGDWCYDKVLNFVFKTDNHTDFKYANQTDNVLKIILTTDQDLIKDGVQAIEDEFLEWFVHNPSCEYVEVSEDYFKPSNMVYGIDMEPYKIIIPKEEPNKTYYLDELPNMDREVLAKMWESAMPKLKPKQESLEEAAKSYAKIPLHRDIDSEERYFNSDVREYDAFIDGAKWQQEQDRWKTVSEETPPSNIELLVQSPKGIVHLSSWREAYDIFSCQAKSESSFDWKWKMI
jgi:hypothetical protein